jgi:hypothetical protein
MTTFGGAAYHNALDSMIMPGVDVGEDAVLVLQTTIASDWRVLNNRKRPLRDGSLGAPLSRACTHDEPSAHARNAIIKTRTSSTREHRQNEMNVRMSEPEAQ